jgi:hypothetical protein
MTPPTAATNTPRNTEPHTKAIRSEAASGRVIGMCKAMSGPSEAPIKPPTTVPTSQLDINCVSSGSLGGRHSGPGSVAEFMTFSAQ